MKKIQVIVARERNGEREYLLLYKRGLKKYWQGVTGYVESVDKTLKDAAAREVCEELGIEVAKDEIVGPLYSFNFLSGGGQVVHEKCYVLLVDGGVDIRLSDEHEKYEWVDGEEAICRIEHQDPKEFLKIVCSKL